MSISWRIALLLVGLLALALAPSYLNVTRHQHPEQFEKGYDWRQPSTQY